MPGSDRNIFPRISDYALIGDCRTAALVATSGAVEWLCLPNIDSPSIFASMLDRERGGHFCVSMRNTEKIARHYLEDTNVLETVFSGPEGRVSVLDFMPVTEVDRLDPERELMRIITCIDGNPEVEVAVSPRPDYGRAKVCLESRGRCGWAVRHGGTHYFIRSQLPLDPGGDGLVGHARLKTGSRWCIALSIATRDPAVLPSYEVADEKLQETVGWWRRWMSKCTYDGTYAPAMRRSLLTLKLFSFALSGAVVAAATTSLPEAIGAGRNWDYRFCWLRDASFMLRAFTDNGFAAEGLAFFDWLMHATRRTQPELNTLYDVFGRANMHERTLPHLRGYRDSAPVRIGNAAKDQLQLDVYGAVVKAARDSIDRGNRMARDELRLLTQIGELVCAQWRRPDEGIWEIRGKRQHNIYSKVMCWSALNDLVQLAEAGIVSVPRDKFSVERDRIYEEVMMRGFNHEIGAFVGAYDADHVDATALLMPRAGIIEAHDPRMLSTWKRIKERLETDGWIRRYEHGTDGMEGEEGAFGICSFWAVDFLARAGRLGEARERLDKLISCASDVGLYSEEFDPATGEFLGNMPQAYTHTGLINAVLTVERIAAGEAPDRGEGKEASIREAADSEETS